MHLKRGLFKLNKQGSKKIIILTLTKMLLWIKINVKKTHRK